MAAVKSGAIRSEQNFRPGGFPILIQINRRTPAV